MEILPKAQRNALLHAVTESGLQADDFSYESKMHGRVWPRAEIVIRHRPTESRFHLFRHRRDDRHWTIVWGVGDDPLTAWSKDDAPAGPSPNDPPTVPKLDFDLVLEKANDWGGKVAEWTKSPDVWEPILGNNAIPGSLNPDSDNTPLRQMSRKASRLN